MSIHSTVTRLFLVLSLSLTGCQLTSESTNKLEKTAEFQTLPVRSDIFQYHLDNGLQVILQPRKNTGVEMRLLVHSGSLQETEQQRGLAHFVEHMAFKGTTHFPNSESFKALESKGITLGSHINAATSYNSTVYKLSLPTSHSKTTDLGLRILSDWASEIRFEPEAFNKEREVIVEEWRLRQGVGARINEGLENLRYQGSRLANRNAIGSINVIRNAPVEEAVAYYKKWYQPQRMTLIVSGQFDNNNVRYAIEEYFAQKQRGNTPEDPKKWQQFPSNKALTIARIFDAENSRKFMQFTLQRDITAPMNSLEGQWQDTLDTLWLSILNQRLEILVANGKIKAATVASKSHLLSKQRLQYLLIAHPFNTNFQEAFDHIATELQRLATQPVTHQELENAKTSVLKKLRQQEKYRHRYGNQYLADQLVQSDTYQLPMMDKSQQLNMVETFFDSITLNDIQKTVEKTLNVSSPKLALIGSDSDVDIVSTTDISTQWQKIRRSLPAPFAMKKPQIDLNVKPKSTGKITSQNTLSLSDTMSINEYQLSNGMKVVVMSNPELKGGTQVNLRLKGGRSLEPNDQLGIVDWASKLSEQCGYGSYTSHQIKQWSKQHQIVASPYSELLHHGFTVSSEADQIDDAFRLLHLKLTQPKLCQNKLDEMKKAMHQNLTKVPAERIFMDNITHSAFVNSTRLVADNDGNWQHFTLPQISKWRQHLFADPSQMITTIVTNTKPEHIEKSIQHWLAGLPTNHQPSLMPVDRGIRPKAINEEKRFPIGSSDKAMVQIQYSNLNVTWSLKDQLHLQLLEQITNMRLREAVRVKASGVYVINMSHMLARDPMPYYLARLNFTTAPSRAKELTQLANEVVQTIRQKGITQKELAQAKQTWQVNQTQQKAYSQYWVASVSQKSFSKLPYQGLFENHTIINETQVTEINALARHLLNGNQKIYTLLPQ